MEFTVADRPLNVVAGIRYEEADVLAIGLESTPTNIRWDMINGLQYLTGGPVDAPKSASNDLVLPQVSMAYSLDDDRVLRFSAGQSMARPSLQDMRSSLNFSNRDFFTPTASGGNPSLEPLKSTNYDLAYEWYYDEGSYFAVNYFFKEIEDFIESQITTGELYGLRNPAYGEIWSVCTKLCKCMGSSR
jgi:Outer membrane receptor proteins, mostly Fe transport